MAGLDLGTFCLYNTSRTPLNLTAMEVETLNSAKRLHCRGAIEPILKKNEISKKVLYWNEDEAPYDGLLADGLEQVDYSMAAFSIEEDSKTYVQPDATLMRLHIRASWTLPKRSS
jgi:hypothetical protein